MQFELAISYAPASQIVDRCVILACHRNEARDNARSTADEKLHRRFSYESDIVCVNVGLIWICHSIDQFGQC